MANVAGHSFPDAETWPYVWMDGYWDIVRNVVPTSLGTGMNLGRVRLCDCTHATGLGTCVCACVGV